MPADGLAIEPTSAIFDPVAARAEHMVPPEERPFSKKEEWLREKTLRPDFRISENELARAANPSRREKAARAKQFSADVAKGQEPRVRPGERIEPVTTLFNIWTHEALPILPGQSQALKTRFHMFLRDHFTNQAAWQRGRFPDPRRGHAPGAALRALAARGRRRVLPALAVRAQRYGPRPLLDRVVTPAPAARSD